MKLFFTAVASFYLIISASAQPIKLVKEFNSNYYEFHEFEINLTSENINISRNGQNSYSENIIGKKILVTSPAENYFLIASYQFSNQKIDYPVEIRVFDRDGSVVFPFKFFAPFDLPHPLITINDNGLLALFDPLSFKVKLISQDSYNEIELEKDIPFEMEKVSFVEMNEDFLFILTSQNALDITENASNVTLYRVNLFDLKRDKVIIDYNTPTLLKLIGGNVFVSGVKFENLKPIGKTIKYDLNLNQLSSNEKIIEKLIPHGKKYYAKYFNTIYDLENDITILNEKQLSTGERILGLALLSEKLVVVTDISKKNILYCFLSDLRVDFKAPLDIFGVNKTEDFSISENFLIIHHDLKSVKIKLNEN